MTSPLKGKKKEKEKEAKSRPGKSLCLRKGEGLH
uniref:Uncharacterized protein n=1 Tax=Anguilla anguilla TaxID=7936 RepID=A0A0E9UIK6_ANGAN